MTEQEKYILLQKCIETAKELQDKATEAENLIFEALSDLGISRKCQRLSRSDFLLYKLWRIFCRWADARNSESI